MSQIKLAFIANDDIAYAPETEVGKHLGFITWTQSKLRIFFPESLKEGDVIQLNHNSQLKLFSSYWTEEEVINFLPQFILRTFLPKNGEDLVVLLESFLGKESSILKLIRVVTPKIDLITYLKQIIKLIYSINQQDILLNYFISAPKVKFSLKPNFQENISSLVVTDKDRYNGFIDIYVGGDFQENKLYGGASPEGKDIEITASCNGESDSIMTMIRVRRNANELTKKAKKNYLEALNAINHLLDQNNEIIEGTNGMGIYTTDFFKMHVKGSKSIAHGTEVFLPWHRLYTLDIERQLQKIKPEVSLHYWKFDEASPNIFKADFLGESVIDKSTSEEPVMITGVTLNFAKFNDENPLKKWAIDKEKLIRRKSWFNNDTEKAGNIVKDQDSKYIMEYVLSDDATLEGKEYLRKNTLNEKEEITADNKSFSGMEGDPHGTAHMSSGGFINYVPTAAKDPLFYFLHSNVERLYSKWQQITFKKWDDDRSQSIKSYPFNAYDARDSRVYENLSKSIKWKNKDTALWPWNGNTTPNDYQLLPVGTRANNFTKSLIGRNFTNPTIENAIDAFGINNIGNYLGYNYDDFESLGLYKAPITANGKSITINNHKLLDSSSNIIISLKNLNKPKFKSKSNKNKEEEIDNPSDQSLSTILNKVTFNSIFSSDFESNKPNLSFQLLNALSETEKIEEVDYIVNNCVLSEIQDIVWQLQDNYKSLRECLKAENKINYIDPNTKKIKNATFSRYLTFYLLSLYGEDIISDADRVEVFRNNVDYFLDIRKEAKEEAIDIAITLLCFASNNTIKNKIAPILFKECQLDINDLKSKTNPKNLDMESPYIHKNDTPEEKEHKNAQFRASMANKYWALHTLLTNAGVVENTNVEEFANALEA